MDIPIQRNRVLIMPVEETGMFEVWQGANILHSFQTHEQAAEWANAQGYEIENLTLAVR